MRQYNKIKEKYPDALLLFRVGDFYETFHEDAVKTSKILGIVLTKRGAGSNSETKLAGFPHHSLNTYLHKLVKAGERVAICDQLEDPKTTKSIVKRGVTELVTPGVALNDGILEKKSKLRNFFETSKKTICIPCYLDSEKELENIAQSEFRKNNISLSREAINLLIEKSNSDRANLKNEIEKIKSYAINKKKLELNEIKYLINFAGDYKSDILVNECLCGNISQYKKIISELYINTVNQILLLRILSNKVQRLLNIKEQTNKSNNLDNLINVSKPPIFWKEKPLVKKQLLIWSLNDLKTIIYGINNTEILCKKNTQLSKIMTEWLTSGGGDFPTPRRNLPTPGRNLLPPGRIHPAPGLIFTTPGRKAET